MKDLFKSKRGQIPLEGTVVLIAVLGGFFIVLKIGFDFMTNKK